MLVSRADRWPASCWMDTACRSQTPALTRCKNNSQSSVQGENQVERKTVTRAIEFSAYKVEVSFIRVIA